MFFGPLDILLALPKKWRDRAQVALGFVLVVGGGYWLIFEAIGSRQMIEGACAAVFGACIAALALLDIRDQHGRKDV